MDKYIDLINKIPEGVYWVVGIFAFLFFLKWYTNRKHDIEGLNEEE